MVVVIAEVIVKEGTVSDFLKVAEPCVIETRKEAGSVSYNLTRDVFEENKFRFVEEWESEEKLGCHFKTPHFIAFSAGIENLLAEELNVKVYNTKE